MKARFVAGIVATVVTSFGAYAWAQGESGVSVNLFPYSDAQAVARGAQLYTENCAACHGASLEGQVDWRSPGENGRMPAPPHDETGHTWHHPDIQLFQIVKYGTAALVGNGYQSDMAAYGDMLSDRQILEVLAYIKSTWPEDIIERHNAMNAAVAAQ
ncbi:MAG: cytochrome c [Octadecabacter sp.]|nr:cytochrome c [Octadecabacter sp.]